jgi:hypothetical protein
VSIFRYGHEQVAACQIKVVRAATDEDILIFSPAEEVHFSGPLKFLHIYFSFPDVCFRHQAYITFRFTLATPSAASALWSFLKRRLEAMDKQPEGCGNAGTCMRLRAG